MSHWLVNLFVPNRANNYKANLLHNSSLALALFFIMGLQAFFFFTNPARQVLGTTTDLTPEHIIELTNQERTAQNLPPLQPNSQLELAAKAKLADMFEFNYWNHYSPSKRAPWKFILDSQYSYQFAGENLGRDFNESAKLVSAWMASPGHRANILKPEYKDIGVAVGQGMIDNKPTVLIVQFFASPAPAGSIVAVGQEPANPEEVFQLAGSLSAQNQGQVVTSFWTTQMIALFSIIFLAIILTVDILILRKVKKIPRISSKYWAHMMFLISCSAITYILTK